jgi:hypothetical protein
MYDTRHYCPIDGGNMKEEEKNYHCPNCGFEYWKLNTEEQTRKEALNYSKTLSDEKIKEIGEAVEIQIKNLHTFFDIGKRARELYEKLKNERILERKRLENDVSVLNSGREAILNAIKTREISYTETTGNKIV